MAYNAEQVATLQQKQQEAVSALDRLLLTAVTAGEAQVNVQAKEYLLYGVGRRLKVLRYGLSTIFRLFPPDTAKPIASDDLEAVQAALHAFVMNLYGTFENLAWAFVCRHDIIDEIGDRRKVGMFLGATQRFLPQVLADYLSSKTMTAWHTQYLKNYRDALAHRIPLYIPPKTFTDVEGKRYQELVREEMECIETGRWEDLERVRDEKANLGRPCFVFWHGLFSEADSKPMQLHSQLVSDVMTILEFGPMYFQHWHERAFP
ncbi:hypothetical protein NUK34_03995 [Kerstersia gyiorum]|uniref:hypothetical protein n=1 Tax=Kerstersia gyiorum TaxID=206506 RepID=UPI002150406A|nr:hypothetical protein [Kerstersia gyiorum]MCR4158016.1 hypothetical protein [Kerstersia gyiorum]